MQINDVATQSSYLGIAISAILVNFMDVTDFDSLYNSMMKCKKGVLWKASVARFYLNGIESVMDLERDLKGGTYKARPPFKFTITSPKPRELVSICFRDRVYQRSLNDNVLYPTMTKNFIYDNHACQIGKGTDKARNRLKCFLNRFFRKYGPDGYVLQIDIHGYYPNMSHSITEDMFRSNLSETNFIRTKAVLDWQYTGEIGYNPGSQMIQIAGISYLNKFDHFCKEKLKVEFYIRYMDDIIIIHHSKEALMKFKNIIEKELQKVDCTFNPRKTEIYRLKEGILFLGFIFRLTDSGKVIMTINPNNLKDERRKLKKLVMKAAAGELTKEQVDDHFECWKANAKKGNNHKTIVKMCKYYQQLWRENGNSKKTKRSKRTGGNGKHNCTGQDQQGKH